MSKNNTHIYNVQYKDEQINVIVDALCSNNVKKTGIASQKMDVMFSRIKISDVYIQSDTL